MKLRALIGAPVRGVQALGRMVFSRSWSWGFGLPRLRGEYWREVGDGTHSSTVAAPLLWFARTFPEAPPMLYAIRDDGQEDHVRDHVLLRLLQKPNDYFTGPELWMATTVDYNATGDAYWLKIRARSGLPVELWWVPWWMIEPKGDDKTFITHYEYTVDGVQIRIPANDVVHFRFGSDPENPRKGSSPLASVLREVFTDDEAARFTASILKNMGVPGLIVSPDAPNGTEASDSDVKATKDYFKGAFSGDRRGEPLVMKGKTKVDQFGFSPEELTLRELRRIPEERVTAVLGIPAIVAGLGAGLDRSTFTNMGEAREAAYEAGIIPVQRIMAEKIRFSLLADFETNPFAWRFGFDLSKVRVLQEDLYRQAQRHDLAIRGGWALVAEGRRPMGLEVDENRDNVFLRPLNVATVPGDGGPVETYAPSQNGSAAKNGHIDTEAVADAVIRAIERRDLIQA